MKITITFTSNEHAAQHALDLKEWLTTTFVPEAFTYEQATSEQGGNNSQPKPCAEAA